MNEEGQLKKRLTKHLQGGEAFTSLGHFISDVPYEKLGIRPDGLPYSIYELFYHMCIAQSDILDFCMAESYESKQWPDEYWPEQQEPKDKEDWNNLKTKFFDDRNILASYLENNDSEIMNVVKHGDDQSLLREVLLVVEHNAYHTGQLMILCRLLGIK